MPQVNPEQPAPEILQMTVVLGLLLTVAVNCSWLLMAIWLFAGDTVTEGPEMIVATAVPDWVGAATDVAVTVIVGGFGAAIGAL